MFYIKKETYTKLSQLALPNQIVDDLKSNYNDKIHLIQNQMTKLDTDQMLMSRFKYN